MSSMTRLLRIVVWLAVIALVCGFLPKLLPAALPTVTVEAEPVICIGGDLLEGCHTGFAITNSLIATLFVDGLLIV